MIDILMTLIFLFFYEKVQTEALFSRERPQFCVTSRVPAQGQASGIETFGVVASHC